MHSNVQRELIGRAVYYPQSWLKLFGRPEIAADLYSDWLFHGATYKDLTTRPRPYVILNASDFTSQERIQFTQDEFDIICDDLSTFPLARAVAASSAFPGLLNSMTVNTFNAPKACPVDLPEPSWLANARRNQFEHRPSYRQALAYDRLTSENKKYLHLLDGGLTDNLGLRAIYEGLLGTAGATLPLIALNNLDTTKFLVIVVNARTGDKPARFIQPDSLPMGPLTLPVIGSTSSMPMGTVSYDSVDMLTELATIWEQARKDKAVQAELYTLELTFENIVDPATRDFFRHLPTDFALPKDTVDCLTVEGRQLLRDAASYSGYNPEPGGLPLPFQQYVRDALKGHLPPETQKAVVANGKCQVQ